MSIIKTVEEKILEIIKKLGYDIEQVTLQPSSRKEFGDYQINDAMALGKKNGKNPRVVAEEIVKELEKETCFTNINIAGPGFINLTLTNEFLIDSVNKIVDIKKNNIDYEKSKTIFLDYGGANCAKVLHVGHLRSADIGEALKRLAKTLGHKTIADVHLGDFGAQAGLVCLETKERYSDLICFKDDYNGEEFDLPFTENELNDIYPTASKRSKEDEEYKEKAREITLKIQNGEIGYSKLWQKTKDLSLNEIKRIYDKLNTSFDLWEGEMDSLKEIPEVLKSLDDQGLTYISENALVMDVTEKTDSKELPPVILKKSNGAYIYASTDLGSIKSRMERFSPDEIWYIADNRQELHFTQVFRAAKKGNLVKDSTKLEFLGFGTVNGEDGKPFKTRDGGVMTLDNLIDIIYQTTLKKTEQGQSDNIEETANTIAIAALKYADLLSFRSTDYIFSPEKFSDIEGKTGPYLLYSTVRIKSLLRKAETDNIKYDEYTKLSTETEKNIILNLLQLPKVLTKSYNIKSLNEIADYLYKLTSSYNKFYSENKVLIEKDEQQKASWLMLSKVVLDTNLLLLDILGINVPEKM